MVEPDAFRRLRANYGASDRIALDNVAVSDRDGRLSFYEVLPDARERISHAGSYTCSGRSRARRSPRTAGSPRTRSSPPRSTP
jgi:hypothetical protein